MHKINRENSLLRFDIQYTIEVNRIGRNTKFGNLKKKSKNFH